MYIVINTNNKDTTISCFEDFSIESEIFSETFPNQQPYEKQIEKIVETIYANKPAKNIKGISIAHAGNINRIEGTILAASHIATYDSKPIVADLQKRFPNIPIYLENDAACAAIAESYSGKAKSFSTSAVMFLSWGIGGAYIKRIGNTFSLFQVEIGHQIIQLNGKICPCGQRGCLEAYVSAQAIQERFLLDQAQLDDIRIWEELVDFLSIGAVNLHTVFTPEAIILSGKTIEEVSYVKENIIPKIQEKIRRKKFPVTI
ncbi:MAG TPA: ROK family protein, partial [Candidatus Saccharimonadales bacterium]|nr:ROK family protein [Candidatus Saccharimonadales bacterium]